MAANYNTTPNKNPGNWAAPAKYHKQVKPGGNATLRQLTKEIAATVTVSTTDALTVTGAFPEVAYIVLGGE